MITYHDLLHADFSGLRNAADSWAKVPKELSGAGGVRHEFDKVSKGLSDGTWTGDAADAAQRVMPNIATQIGRAGDEAHDIAKLLDDAHTEFTTAQSSLKNIVGDVTSENSAFTIDASGTVTPKPGGDPRLAQSAWQTADSYNTSIQQLLHDATETDRALRYALRDDTDGAKDQGFSEGEFSSIAGAESAQAKSLRDARTAVDLAKKVPLTHDDARKLNALLADHTGDPAFGAAFATGLGPDNTLSLWASASTTFGTGQIGHDTMKSLQSNLGYTLAAATHEHTPAMEKWQKEMVAAASRPVPHEPELLGCQVMSNLMRTGDYDKGFLAPYGHELMKIDENRKVWNIHPGVVSQLNYLGGSAYDPMEGYMDSLDHNPGYATTFLDESGTFHHLASRTWYDHGTSFGQALMAGTTGRTHDTPPGVAFPKHTGKQADLMGQAIRYYGRDTSSPVPSGMAKSLGRMSSEYIPDFDRAVCGTNPYDTDSGKAVPASLEDNPGIHYFPSNGTPIHLKTRDATRFLYRLGKSPDAFAPISVAQTRYTSGALLYHAHNPHLLGRLSYANQIPNIVGPGNTLQTIINTGAADNTVGSAATRDAAYNQSMSQTGEWVKAGVGLGAGLTEEIPSPARWSAP